MYVLFEEEGMFKTGHIMSESDAALQVESESGKRSKIKRANCLFTFTSPAPDVLMPEAQRLSEEIELQFLWECAPQDEFDIETLGTDYFGHPVNTLEKTTLLLRLHSAPTATNDCRLSDGAHHTTRQKLSGMEGLGYSFYQPAKTA